MITVVQEEVYSLFDNLCRIESDELGVNFDFNNEIGVYYNMSNILDMEYKNTIPLIITLVGIKNNKIEMQELAKEIDAKLNKAILTNSRIVRQNTYFNSFIDDEEKNNIVLSYYIYKF